MLDTIQCQSAQGFKEVLANLNGSLAVSTYQAGKLMLEAAIMGRSSNNGTKQQYGDEEQQYGDEEQQ
jgi:hypothetical protein